MRKILKEARRSAGKTQREMAEYLGITIRSYQRMESGDYIGRISHWDALGDLSKIHQRELRSMTKDYPPEAGKRN